MSPSDHSLSGPRAGRTIPAVPAGISGSGVAVPATAALAGAAVLLLSALGPLRESVPWLLPLMAAGSGAAGGLALLSIRSVRRRPAGDQRPQAHPEPAPSAQADVPDAETSATNPAHIAALEIAALQEALRECGRQANERLRSQQIAAMDARAGLAGAIVHDMNNTLGAVAGYADFLVCDLPAGSPQADYAGRAIAAIDRARSGLRRLVAEARTERVHLKPERAAAVLDEAATLLRSMAPTSPSSLSIRHDAATPAPICNAGLLARTLAGLAAEILAATGRGGDARLCLRAFFPADADDPDADAVAAGWTVRPLLTPLPGPHALFELRVDGPPLADEVLAGLADPLLAARTCYRRGQTSGTEDAHWPAALQTARCHDGGLSLLTHPTEGMAVWLHIPASRSPAPAAPFPRAAKAPARHHVAPTYKILVVDADPASGDRFQAGLERQGFEVSVCEDLREALEVVTDEPGFFDAVVIGPGLSALPAGQALAGRLKALRAELPCVLYAAAGPASAGLGAEAGGPADLLLPLPVDLPRLARGVAALAAGGPRYADDANGPRHADDANGPRHADDAGERR